MTSNIDAPRKPDTVVLIHGLWMTPRSWERWVERYEARGYKVLAPAWPGMEGEVEALNRDPSPIGELDIEQIVDHYEKIIRALDAPPIVMGHSFGGAFTQLLLDRGLGAAGVGVASGTVKGVPDLPLSTIKATSPVLRNPFNRGKAVPLDEKQFHYAFANTLDREESDELYRRYHVPAASTVLFEGAFANLRRHPPTEVNFDNDDRAPLLFIAFESDHIIPPKASRHNAEKYAGSSAITAFKEFPGRPHFPGVRGWEEVADYAIEWAEKPQATIPVSERGAVTA
jgi:pimeloyl-ACP methyl ester carboxylesterase